MGIKALQEKLLRDPVDINAWNDLAINYLLLGNKAAAAVATGVVNGWTILGDESNESRRPIHRAKISNQEVIAEEKTKPFPPISSEKASAPETLEEIATQARKYIDSQTLPYLVISVASGTITIATKQHSAELASLYYRGEHTHIQISEQLLYRDPSSGIRLVALTFQPLHLVKIQERTLESFSIRYGSNRAPLREAIPSLQPSLSVLLEGWNGQQLRGWAAFIGADPIPRTPLMIAQVDDRLLQVIKPTIVRHDVMAAIGNPHALKAGFQLESLGKLLHKEGSRFVLRDPITFNTISSHILSKYHLIHEQILKINQGYCGYEIQEHNEEIVFISKARRREQLPTPIIQKGKLDILVPVYKNWDMTRQCLYSVSQSVKLAQEKHPDIEIYIHATNDCSPDQEVNAGLPLLCTELGVILRTNERNLGFIRSVNNFMNGTGGDILLVNSDVIISLNTVSEFLRARKSIGPALASLTAFSNNATIYSYPYVNIENELSSPAAIERIADTFMSVSSELQSITLQVPVTHGFLAYLTRTAIASIGTFDEYFGLGYGEEVDWCMKAGLKGFEHHLCLSAFAYHKGSISFGKSTRLKALHSSSRIIAERYPYYDRMIAEYCLADELLPYRNQVGTSLLERSDKPLRIHVTHTSGGGIDNYIKGMIQTQHDVHHAILDAGRSYQDLVSGTAKAAGKIFEFSLFCSNLDALISGELSTDIIPVLTKLLGNKIDFVFHSFVGWKADEVLLLNDFCRSNKLEHIFIAHDYMSICPRIKLIDSQRKYCGVGDDTQCSHCLRTGEPSVESSLLAPFTSDIQKYRGFFGEILRGSKRVYCSTQEQVIQFEEQGFNNIELREPFEPSYMRMPNIAHDSTSRNIVIIGNIGLEKGCERLYQVASQSLQINSAVHYYLVGAAANIEILRTLPNFTHVSSYKNFNELHEHIRRIYSPIAFFPAIWPETWCYTLSEALMLSLPVIAPSLGAIGSRLAAKPSNLSKLYSATISDYKLAELVCSIDF